MEANFSPRVKDVITYSREEALRLGHDYIGIEHLLLGIIREGDGLAVKILKSLKVNLVDLRKTIEQSAKIGSGKSNHLANIPLVLRPWQSLLMDVCHCAGRKTVSNISRRDMALPRFL